jgi:tripartite-type tricarboxylate transporter receptor subunit TctC
MTRNPYPTSQEDYPMKRAFQKGMLPILAVIFFLTLLLGVQPISAAEWPEKDIILIVPYAAGGGYDVVARATAPFIEKNLPKKANVVVKNVPGAGGKIGFMEMVRSKPDGYTLAILDPADVAVLQVSGQVEGVDILKLSWLGRLDKLPDLLTVSSKSGFKAPKDMQSRPVRFAGIGPGVTFRSSVIAKGLGVDARFISYDGTSPASIAAIQGDIDAFVVNWVSATRMVETSEGKLVPMFVAASEKVDQIKQIPCASDLGIKVEESVLGYSHILVGPANLPPEVVHNWNDVLAKTFADQAWADQMNKAKYPPSPLTGEPLTSGIAKTLKATQELKPIIDGLGIK